MKKKGRAELGSTDFSLRTALALYDEIFVLIYPGINTALEMERIFHFSVDEMAYLAEEGRIIIGFNNNYENYNVEVISPFLKPGIRHISADQWELVTLYNVSNVEYLESPLLYNAVDDFPELKSAPYCFNILLANGFYDPFKTILERIEKGELTDIIHQCILCYSMYAHRFLDATKLQAVPIHNAPTCVRANKLLNEISHNDCILNEGYFGSDRNIESICEGLKINYTKDLPLDEYVEIIDGNTTKAIRNIVNNLLTNPTNIKYKQRLFSNVYLLNQEVEELSESKLAKIGITTTDMISYYLKKIAPDGLVTSGIDWLANISLKLQAKLLRKDWATLQLYRTREKLETRI